MWKSERSVSSSGLLPGRNGGSSPNSGHPPKSARCPQPACRFLFLRCMRGIAVAGCREGQDRLHGVESRPKLCFRALPLTPRAASEHADESDVWKSFLAGLGVISPDKGKVISENKAVTDMICAELLACFFTHPSIIGDGSNRLHGTPIPDCPGRRSGRCMDVSQRHLPRQKRCASWIQKA